MKTFRIHGDNIVECERIMNIIINTLNPLSISTKLVSPSTIAINIKAVFQGNTIELLFELLPGFNKNTKHRWSGNIFNPLKIAGGFFDETPDVIISSVNHINKTEEILLGLEFCSALQAGNQAWQRSARAFSIGRTGCPYIYIVDFVKYELDNKTRKRKNLRFPNAAVPYSYVSYSKNTKNFIAQLYTKSEEFDKSKDSTIKEFDDSNFGDSVLAIYILKRLLDMDTSMEEKSILNKNINVVKFLANNSDKSKNYTSDEWKEIYELANSDIINYAVDKKRFTFHKTITEKSHHGESKEFVKLVDKLSIGLASKDLPFGIIPAEKRPNFAQKISKLYPSVSETIIKSLSSTDKHLILAIFKGFKPRGDDNRPDRGLLPLCSMLSTSDIEVMSYIYGPIIEQNLVLLEQNPYKLANKNGLWHSILALSNYIILDAPVLASPKYSIQKIYDTTSIRNYFSNLGTEKSIQSIPTFSNIPMSYGEDDVDTAIHYLFTHILSKHCFESLCNPPGGDWSGFSIIDGEYENRWLSLPRISDVINGKRPDHILEFFGIFNKPLLLSIESKERSSALENNVGTKLVSYIKNLMDYIPSAKRKVSPEYSEWQWGDKKVLFSEFETISAAAYLKKYAEPPSIVFKKNCELLFVMEPIMIEERIGWEIEIIPSSQRSKLLKDFIISNYNSTKDTQFLLK